MVQLRVVFSFAALLRKHNVSCSSHSMDCVIELQMLRK